MSEYVRLNKFISATGFCSRRKADEWIAAGKVEVNGIPADMGMKVCSEDEVIVNGKRIEKKDGFKLVLFYKPKGYSVTFHGGDTSSIFHHFPLDSDLRYVGRLDKDSEGLLLLTNDGDLCNEIAKSRNDHEKEYIVTVNKNITDDFIERMENGVRIFDGNKNKYVVTKPCVIQVKGKRVFSIILTQGYNRQIRRMCEYFDYKVVKLRRIRVMNLLLGDMKPGEIRNATPEEAAVLKSKCMKREQDEQTGKIKRVSRSIK